MPLAFHLKEAFHCKHEHSKPLHVGTVLSIEEHF